MKVEVTFYSIDNVSQVSLRKIDGHGGTPWYQLTCAGLEIDFFNKEQLDAFSEAFANLALQENPVEEDNPTTRPCEICVERNDATIFPSTSTIQDKFGNDVRVCEFHEEEIAATKPERQADVAYDESKDR